MCCRIACARFLLTVRLIDAKARKEMMEAAKGKKGPLNTGQQGIKKSGKK